MYAPEAPMYAGPQQYVAAEQYMAEEYVYPEYGIPAYEYVEESGTSTMNVVMLAVAGVGVAYGLTKRGKRTTAPEMKAALLYSTTTGNTETAAGYIAEATGLEAVDIGDVDVATINECDSLIIGAPTWHTGADSERSGTAWDEFLYGDLTSLDLKGKKVAIFGMGDQAGYADNYCDAMDELESCFKAQGAEIVGAWPTAGYEHEESKSVRGDNFVGCAFDEDNQPDQSEERAKAWVEQIKGEGIAMLAVAGKNATKPKLFTPRTTTPEMKAALLYSTTTGNTETAAGYIAEATGLEAVDIADVDVATINECDSLIIGAPTWHTGADTERSGTAWDEFLYGDLTSLDLKGKKVAIFGMGDQAGYADNYCDAMDELESCFKAQGADIVGAWPTAGYEHEESKSVRGDNFVGCAFDEDNQPDQSEERAKAWVAQIKGEGITV
jgi:flavodoxin I